MDSGRLDTWTLYAWTLDDWTLDDWALRLWTLRIQTLGPRKFYLLLVASFLLLFRHIILIHFLFCDTCSTWNMYRLNLILFLLSYFLLKMVSVMNEPHCHKNNHHRFDKTNCELTKKVWFKERFASSKQMFRIDKMSPKLLRMNLPQIFTIYDI